MAIVPYRVAAETDRQLETRTFQLGGQTLIIRQAGARCSPRSFTPMLAPFCTAAAAPTAPPTALRGTQFFAFTHVSGWPGPPHTVMRWVGTDCADVVEVLDVEPRES